MVVNAGQRRGRAEQRMTTWNLRTGLVLLIVDQLWRLQAQFCREGEINLPQPNFFIFLFLFFPSIITSFTLFQSLHVVQLFQIVIVFQTSKCKPDISSSLNGFNVYVLLVFSTHTAHWLAAFLSVLAQYVSGFQRPRWPLLGGCWDPNRKHFVGLKTAIFSR